ncbi:MAG: serine hydrolase [Bacteroidota bacterium]
MPTIKFILVSIALLLLSCTAANQKNSSGDTATIATVDAFLETQMAAHEIPGLALAVIQAGKLVHEGYYGKADVSHDVPVQASTIFRVFSCTKLLVSTAVFQLIQEGKLALTDELQQFFPDLTTSWQSIRIEHLLSHASGLPDLIYLPEGLGEEELLPLLQAEDIQFPAGERFRYNQTNYWLLKCIIEQLSGAGFDSFILDNQFESQEAGVAFSSNSLAVLPNRAHRYIYNAERKLEFLSVNNASWAHSGNGLNVSLPAFIGWSQRFDAGELLEESSKSLMWSDFEFADEPRKFLRGWGVYEVANQRSIGFTGGGVAAYRKFPDRDITIILMTNGYKYYPVHNDLVDQVAALVDPALLDPEANAANEVATTFLKGSFEEGQLAYEACKNDFPDLNLEDRLNRIGYALMSAGQLEEAVTLFQFNVAEHTNSWNVYDSLAEGFANQGQIDLAIENYKHSISLNPDNQNGIDQLAILTANQNN